MTNFVREILDFDIVPVNPEERQRSVEETTEGMLNGLWLIVVSTKKTHSMTSTQRTHSIPSTQRTKFIFYTEVTQLNLYTEDTQYTLHIENTV